MKAEIRVSLSSRESPDLYDITMLLCKLEIAGTVFMTMSSVCENDVFMVEPGFVMYMYSVEKHHIRDMVWPKLKEMFPSSLICAHVSDSEGSSCCIFDYIRQSCCPNIFLNRLKKDEPINQD
jgi:hypothetical protein